MKRLICLVLALSGCTPLLRPTGNDAGSVVLYPEIAPKTQTVVPEYSVASIATLSIVPFIETTPNTYAPVSLTGGTTTDGSGDMLQLIQTAPIDPTRPFVLRNLKPNKNYRIYGRAYNSSNQKISDEETSFVALGINSDNAPAMENLPIRLVKVPFAATTSVSLNIDGRFDYLKTMLYKVSGNVQVAVSQSTRTNPEIMLASLQGNTNYRFLLEAYKCGSMVSSTSMDLNIANENAPATQSLSLTVPYIVTTIAGTGAQGSANGAATSATFKSPADLVYSNNALYITDEGNQLIRKLDLLTNQVSTVAGNGTAGYADGVGTAAQFNLPGWGGIGVGNGQEIYVADTYNGRIRAIDPATQQVTTFAAVGSLPSGVDVGSDGTLYVANHTAETIQKVDPVSKVVTTLAGSGAASYADGTGTGAAFYHPCRLSLGQGGEVYVVDEVNNRIRLVTPTGVVTTLAGGGASAEGIGTSVAFTNPYGITVGPDGNIFITEIVTNHRIRKINPITKKVTTIAGGAPGFNNGTGISALFTTPQGITVAPNGVLYVTDRDNHRIRMLQ